MQRILSDNPFHRFYVRDGLVVVWGVSVDTTIIYTFLSAPAFTACNDMVDSMVKELPRLKTLVSFLHGT